MTLKELGAKLGPALGLAATWALFALLAGSKFTSASNHELMLPRSMWSIRRPGVATRMSMPRRMASSCGFIPAPP